MRLLLAAALSMSFSGTVSAQDYNSMSTDELKSSLTSAHPAAYYILANKLFYSGKKDEAVFWFYAGQLRYRVHLACPLDQGKSGDAALFGSFSEVIGRPLNEYAFGDVDEAVKTIDAALEWDARNKNDFTSKTKCASQLAQNRAGLQSLRDSMIKQADDIRAKRKANGLPNR
ncbi:hypothetical protein ABFT80_05695 [Mesorhizobium sp. SB112]|uniref:hypothetical protein n=1 Tax=Mesorhizobium sp. SB112 TaxID=3151853 RepID=UPI003263E31F